MSIGNNVRQIAIKIDRITLSTVPMRIFRQGVAILGVDIQNCNDQSREIKRSNPIGLHASLDGSFYGIYLCGLSSCYPEQFRERQPCLIR